MRTRSATRAKERARDAERAVGLDALPDELLARVLTHLPSIRDFGRADGVCRAWRARGSPVEQALRGHIEVRDGAEQCCCLLDRTVANIVIAGFFAIRSIGDKLKTMLTV